MSSENECKNIGELSTSDKMSLYQILMSHRQHAENVFWSRIQILHAIQAAVLVGGYYLWENTERWYAIPLLVLGLVLTVLLRILARNDWNDANINKKLMDSLESCLKFSRAKERHCLRSHKILYALIYLLGGVDLLCIGVIIGSMV
ncbi:hypothetical protein ACFLYF_01500 [Chloroflexota bacterium]